MFTAQTQLVAEELCVPIARVKLIQCDTAITPDQGTTSGSQSTPTNFNSQNLALAAATAREALLSWRRRRWALRLTSLTVADGVINGRRGRRVTYAELVGGGHFNLTLSPTAKRRSAEQWTVLGKPVPSLDRSALMTGRFEFVHSLRVPGMLHGRVVRPPGMGATVASVDRGSVRHIPGGQRGRSQGFRRRSLPKRNTQAVLAARQLAVRWNPGPELPPQKDFFEHLQEAAFAGHSQRRFGRCRKTACGGRPSFARAVHLSVSNARLGGRILRGGRRQGRARQPYGPQPNRPIQRAASWPSY